MIDASDVPCQQRKPCDGVGVVDVQLNRVVQVLC